MPIGVPRIIYCWGEELPAQWTDIYNFIFRRRMVFLMQYLDDELCNQICGLLINIHMEDRSKDLERKEMERSGVFKSGTSSGGKKSSPTESTSAKRGTAASNENGGSLSVDEKRGSSSGSSSGRGSFYNKKARSMEDLLNADEDLGIDEIDTLEQHTLQKITTEWLNWNAQFFDYADEPYLFYLAELLSKDFNKGTSSASLPQKAPSSASSVPKGKDGSEGSESTRSAQMNQKNLSAEGTEGNNSLEQKVARSKGSILNASSLLPTSAKREKEIVQLLNMLKNTPSVTAAVPSLREGKASYMNKVQPTGPSGIYAPFRTHANFASGNFPLKQVNSFAAEGNLLSKLFKLFQDYQKKGTSLPIMNHAQAPFPSENRSGTFVAGREQNIRDIKKTYIYQFLSDLGQKDFSSSLPTGREGTTAVPKEPKEPGTQNFSKSRNPGSLNEKQSNQKVLSQRNLRREYGLDGNFSYNESVPISVGRADGKSRIENVSLADKRSLSTTGRTTEFNPNILAEGVSLSERKGDSHFVRKSSQKTSPLYNYLDPSANASHSFPSGSAQFGGTSSSAAGVSTEGGSFNSKTDEFRDYYRKQTERSLIEEESKKVFVIINSFGGSVGNGVTVHDALQFIKAGSLTLALGVAASAASLALAGGTIGERYVTEGCHVMIHQPESSLSGQASDIWIDSQEIMKIRLDVAEIYSLSTYRPRHKILRDLDRDFYLTASETIQYGLADEIATNEVMTEIIEMTSKVWDYHETKQQRLLETRESANAGSDTQIQN